MYLLVHEATDCVPHSDRPWILEENWSTQTELELHLEAIKILRYLSYAATNELM